MVCLWSEHVRLSKGNSKRTENFVMGGKLIWQAAESQAYSNKHGLALVGYLFGTSAAFLVLSVILLLTRLLL